jgi:colicin import membrane protein
MHGSAGERIMIEDSRVPVDQPEWDRGLWWMVLVSGTVHLACITAIVLMPSRFLHHPPPLKSYTVDLVAPDLVGGTNMIAGGKGRVQGAPLAAAPKVEPPKPPPPKVEEPKPPEPKPEPPKPEPEKVGPPKPEPKPEPPKPEPQPKENEAVLAEKVKQVEPPPPPTAAKSAPAPQAKSAAQPKAVAKAEPPKAQVKPDPKAAAEAAKATKEAAATHERDDRLAAAVKRVEEQVGKRGAGTGTKAGEQPGGPLSVGPGEGAGGSIKGVEYLLYYNQMINRIKQAWVWAGAKRELEAAVRFNITDTGEVANVRITHPSGDASYDVSVERAVRASNPLSPPPESYRKEFSDVELTFQPGDLKM